MKCSTTLKSHCYTALWCIANLTLIFHKVVQRRIWVLVGHFIIALLDVCCWVCL